MESSVRRRVATTVVRRPGRQFRHRRHGRLVAVGVGLVVAGLGVASAASLGGVTARTLGADVAVVASCDTDGVTLAYTNAYSATLGRYQTTSVTVSGIAAGCAGKALALTLRDAANASVGSGSIASLTAAASQTVTLTAPGANATQVAGAAVVISG